MTKKPALKPLAKKASKKPSKKKPEEKREMSPELRAMLNDYAERMRDLLVTRMNRPKPEQPLIPLPDEPVSPDQPVSNEQKEE